MKNLKIARLQNCILFFDAYDTNLHIFDALNEAYFTIVDRNYMYLYNREGSLGCITDGIKPMLPLLNSTVSFYWHFEKLTRSDIEFMEHICDMHRNELIVADYINPYRFTAIPLKSFLQTAPPEFFTALSRHNKVKQVLYYSNRSDIYALIKDASFLATKDELSFLPIIETDYVKQTFKLDYYITNKPGTINKIIESKCDKEQLIVIHTTVNAGIYFRLLAEDEKCIVVID